MPRDARRPRLTRRAGTLRILLGTAVLGLAVPLAAGCPNPPHTPETPRPAPLEQLPWREVTLPAPGGAGRLAVRDATACGGKWYVVGAVVAADGTTRPAAWGSGDGRTWTSLRLTPRSTYGRVAVLYAAGCRDGSLAVIGAQNGGAHGNPRVTQWRLRPGSGSPDQGESPDQRDSPDQGGSADQGAVPDASGSPDRGGVLDEELAGFELYGGPDAVNVARIAGGPAGWLITGNRVSGAATWVSAGPAATGFRLVSQATELASDARLATEATDASGYQTGWIVVGGGRPTGSREGEPLAWMSADGRSWRRMAVPAAGDGYQLPQRVIGTGDGLVAAGLAGDRFGAWRLAGGQWRADGPFGSPAGSALQQVQGMAATSGTGGDRVWVAASDGREYQLWMSPGGDGAWHPVQLPLALAAAGADHALTVTGAGSALLLVADDGRAGRAWLAG